MGALIGAGLGALLGVAGGYERQKAVKTAQSNAAFVDLAVKNPAVFAGHPELLNTLGKSTSKEFAQLIGGIGEQQAQALSKGAAVFGGARPAGPTAGAPNVPAQQGAGPAGPPSDINVLRDELAQADQFMQGPAWASIDPTHQKIFTTKYEQWSKTLEQMEKEQREPAEAAARVTAEKKAGLAPDIVAGEASAAAMKSGAETSARVGVENSPGAISGAASKAAAEESARLAVSNSAPAVDAAVKKAVAEENAKRAAAAKAPMTPAQTEELKSKIETRTKNLIANYTATHKPGIIGTAASFVTGGGVTDTPEFKDYVIRADPTVAGHLYNIPAGAKLLQSKDNKFWGYSTDGGKTQVAF